MSTRPESADEGRWGGRPRALPVLLLLGGTLMVGGTPGPGASADALMAAGIAGAAVAGAPEVSGGSGDDGVHADWLDRSVSPADDFFRFANGGWLKAHPIPRDRSYWGVDSVLEQENQSFIRDLIASLADQAPAAGTPQRKVADFYASGMDEAAIDAAGAQPLAAELARIASIRDLDALEEEFAHLQTLGVAAPLALAQMQDFEDSARVIATAAQSGLGLPNRDYYLQNDRIFKAVRSAYGAHIARMLQLLGDSAEWAAMESKSVLALETRLAAVSMSDVEQRNPHAIYHPLSTDQAQALTPNLHWQALLRRVGHPDIVSLNIGMPDFFRELDRQLVRTRIDDWKTYLRWQLINTFAPFLSKSFVDEDFRMTSALTGAETLQPRWLRVLSAEDQALGFAIGQIYVTRRFPPAARQGATAIVERVREALRADLSSLDWMSPATRAAAARKLDRMELRVGYPDRWRDYSGLEIDRGPYVLNVMRANRFEFERQLGKVGKPVDRTEWYMTPQTVNAYYDPSMNSLNVPAGILQAPYFDANWPDAVNYGATGATVGHEMTHGFDDEGAQFDGDGNLRDWWAPADLARFRAATQCISEQYSRLTVGRGLHLQGGLVTGEATADLGGVILAWKAMHALNAESAAAAPAAGGLTLDQLFFVAYAHSWASALRPQQAEEQATTDPHPPAAERTNATLANVAEFQSAFSAMPGAPMVKPRRCVIW